jgi:hypothetical protein
VLMKKIKAVNYKTKAVTEIEISVLSHCSAPNCTTKAIGTIIFDEPYSAGRETVQGEYYLCEFHMNDLLTGKQE